VTSSTNEKKKTVPSKLIGLGAATNWSNQTNQPIKSNQQPQAKQEASSSNDLFSLNDQQPLPQNRL